MIAEFAVEPASIVTSWDRFDNVTSRFGFDRGRTISDFAGKPDVWAQRVVDAAMSTMRPVERARVADRLRSMKAELGILRLRDNYVGGAADWGSNVVREHARRPWDGIVSRTGACGVLPACAADRISDDPRFGDEGLPYQQRSTAALTALTGRLLSVSRRVDIIDPRMFCDRRWFEPVSELINLCAHGEREVGAVTLHMDHRHGTNDVDFISHCRVSLAPRLRSGLRIAICRWAEAADRTHERAVISELGGYRIDAGLDPCAGATTAVARISRAEAKRVRERYSEGGPLRLLQRSEIVGARNS